MPWALSIGSVRSILPFLRKLVTALLLLGSVLDSGLSRHLGYGIGLASEGSQRENRKWSNVAINPSPHAAGSLSELFT